MAGVILWAVVNLSYSWMTSANPESAPRNAMMKPSLLPAKVRYLLSLLSVTFQQVRPVQNTLNAGSIKRLGKMGMHHQCPAYRQEPRGSLPARKQHLARLGSGVAKTHRFRMLLLLVALLIPSDRNNAVQCSCVSTGSVSILLPPCQLQIHSSSQ